MHNFLARYLRYATHLAAYLALAANPYPGFTGHPGYPVDITIPERQPQSRWTVGFRLFLALPALVLAAVLGSGFGGGGGGSQSTASDDVALALAAVWAAAAWSLWGSVVPGDLALADVRIDGVRRRLSTAPTGTNASSGSSSFSRSSSCSES